MIVILGSGVAGASLAWALTRRGQRDVVVLDPLPRGVASSERATGGFRTQFENPLNIRLSLASLPTFVALGDRIRWRQTGYLHTASDAAGASELKRRADIQRTYNLPISHPDIRTVLPFFTAEGITGTNFCPLDGVYHPPSVRAAFIAAAQEGGAAFCFGEPGEPAKLAEPLETWVSRASVVVVACGIWSRAVGASLGVELAVTPSERGAFTVAPAFPLPAMTPLTIDICDGWVFRERDGELMIVTPGEPNDWSCVREWLAAHIPTAAVTHPATHWTGYYEVTFDHHPLVGQTENPKIWASCGFSGHGVMHAPAIAENLAAMILGDSPSLDIAALSPLRTAPLIDATQV